MWKYVWDKQDYERTKFRYFNNTKDAEWELNIAKLVKRQMASGFNGGVIYLNDDERVGFLNAMVKSFDDKIKPKLYFSQMAWDYSRLVIDLDVTDRDLGMD